MSGRCGVDVVMGTMRASGRFTGLMVVDRDAAAATSFLVAAIRHGIRTRGTQSSRKPPAGRRLGGEEL